MATTPRYAIPYPVSTDKVIDGENAMQAIAERLEAIAYRVLAYAEQTVGGQGIGPAEVAITGLTITTPSLPAGHRVRVSSYLDLSQATAPARQDVHLKEGAVRLQAGSQNVDVGGYRLYRVEAIVTPAAGPHTYTVTALCTANNGLVNASATSPAWIMAEDLGSIT